MEYRVHLINKKGNSIASYIVQAVGCGEAVEKAKELAEQDGKKIGKDYVKLFPEQW